jgi:hypothetical protein
MINKLKMGAILVALVASAGSSPVAAQSGDARIDRWSEQGRRATGAVGYVSGYRMCGPRCADGMRRATDRVYVESRRAANRYDNAMRNVGRSIGRRVRGR